MAPARASGAPGWSGNFLASLVAARMRDLFESVVLRARAPRQASQRDSLARSWLLVFDRAMRVLMAFWRWS